MRGTLPGTAVGITSAGTAAPPSRRSSARRPARARPARERRAHAPDLARQQARADQRPWRLGDPRRDRLEQRRREVRDERGGLGRRPLAQVQPHQLELDPVRGGVLRPRPPAPPARCRTRSPARTPASPRRSPAPPTRCRGRRAGRSPRRRRRARAAARGTCWWLRGPRCQTLARDRQRCPRGFRRTGPASQDGLTTIRPPAIETGSWKSRQRSAQSSGISVALISTRPSPAAARSSGTAGTSPGGP